MTRGMVVIAKRQRPSATDIVRRPRPLKVLPRLLVVVLAADQQEGPRSHERQQVVVIQVELCVSAPIPKRWWSEVPVRLPALPAAPARHLPNVRRAACGTPQPSRLSPPVGSSDTGRLVATDYAPEFYADDLALTRYQLLPLSTNLSAPVLIHPSPSAPCSCLRHAACPSRS